MKHEHLQLIRNHTLFSQISDIGFQDLVRGAFVQNFPAEVQLIAEGEQPDFLYIVESGQVELFSSWQGRDTTMAMLFHNATFILAATVTDGPYLMSARTREKSQIIMIPSQNVRHAFVTEPVFATAVATEMAYCYRAVVRNTKDLKLRNTNERLANYLLKVAYRSEDPNQIELAYEKKFLASKLGMTPEHLSRALNSMKDLGVDVRGNKVAITDISALERFAKPDPLIDYYGNIRKSAHIA